MFRKVFVCITGIAILLPCLASCKSSKVVASRSEDNGHYGYKCVSFSVPEKEGYEVIETKVLSDAENYYVATGYVKTNEKAAGEDAVTDIYTVDQKGEISHTLELYGLQIPEVMTEDAYVFIGYANEDLASGKDTEKLTTYVVYIDRKTGNELRVVEPGFLVTDLYSVEQGLVLIGQNTIAKVDKNGAKTGTVDTGKVSLAIHESPFFQQGEKFYACHLEEEYQRSFYEVDFGSGTLRHMTNENGLGEMQCFSDGYFFDESGEYSFSLTNNDVRKMADFSEINVRPPRRASDGAEYIAIDDLRFAIEYPYKDGTYEILFFSYDASIDYSGYEKIVIGGYGRGGIALQWAIYNFNSTNKKYHVVYEDYSEQFGWTSAKDAMTQNLNLIKYFNEGHAPDIFYGNSFDYDYFGKSNMVVDLLPYFQSEKELAFEQFSPAIREIIQRNDACYQLFSGYTLQGYLTKYEDMKSNEDISLSKFMELCDKKNVLPYAQEPGEIISQAIMYNFPVLWKQYEKDPEKKKQDMRNLVSIAVERGVTDHSYTNFDEFQEGTYMVSPYSIWDILDMAENETRYKQRYSFIGYPSVDGDVNLVNPSDLVAISSNSKHPDICWEIIRQMFSEDVQRLVAVNNMIPVRQDILDEICAGAVDRKKIKNDLIKEYFQGHAALDPKTVEDYKEMLDCADTLNTVNWSIYSMILDEIDTYYSQNRSVDQITDSLISRLDLYYQEYYQ
ncbi:MAG: hypothetical protein IKG93_09800 [Clostridiales bacterium]|nr:hypothetical protein [Clostridiales bacterium]